MRLIAFILSASCVAGVPLLCPVVVRAQANAQAPAKPVLPSASKILAQLPAIANSEMEISSAQDQSFFGAQYIEQNAAMVPDAARVVAWREEAERYKKAGGALTAAAWLQLEARRAAILTVAPAPSADGTAAIEREPYVLTPSLQSAANLLPAPDQWRALLQGARKSYDNAPTEHNSAIYYFAARLNGDEDEQVAALRALYRIYEPQFRADMTDEARTSQDNYGGDGQRRAALERDKALAEFLVNSPDVAQQQQGLRWQLKLGERLIGNFRVGVPDLVRKWGAARARAFLPELLRSKANLEWYNAGQTADLARELWLAKPEFQKFPQWELEHASGDMDLPFALALLEKFPPKRGKKDVDEQNLNEVYDNTDAYSYRNLQTRVLEALLKRDQRGRASELMARWNRQGWVNADFTFYLYDNAATPAQQNARLDWVEATMTRYPVLNWWFGYRNLALQSGQSERALSFVRARLQKPGGNRGALKSALSSLYLDAGEIEKGGALLAELVEAGTRGNQDFEGRANNIANLLRLTRVAPRLKWLQIARRGAQSLANKPLAPGNGDQQIVQLADIALQLHEQKQSVFAGQMLAKVLVAGSQKPREDYYSAPIVRPALYALMVLYRDANRPADALYLLENARGWGADELTPILTYKGEQQWGGDKTDIDFKARPPLGELATWALARSDRRDKAIEVARATLQRDAGNDGVYALLVGLQGQKAVPFLKQLQARDPYEERPLIWQAELARRAGDTARAAQLAQRAIDVDPSDGEQPRGNRLRAYSELASIRRAQGNAAKANELHEAVRAIRLSETADRWRVAGVAPRAIELYRKSLGLFDNAYCVQSRLAVELTSQGEFEQAAQHFERAYQLMPVSFGRMESHCFGCEGVFGNTQSEPIARRVFRQLEVAQPNNAKVQYLAGYWRQTAGQGKEATRYFQRAVKLDPLYLSAWQKLNDNSTYQTPREQDAATLAVLRLDPSGQHDPYGYGYSMEIKQNFRALWQVTEAILPRKNLDLRANFPLPKSSDANGESYGLWQLVNSPANAIAQQEFVRTLDYLD